MKAFPVKGWNGHEETINEGMDLRDYFAAKAMQGDISRYENKDNPEYWAVKTVAQRSYAMADAMMEARNG